jgi:DNA-binding transcriptional LysR family regulator
MEATAMYNITFQQIETFLTVAEHLNLSSAAEAMYISQPSLSKTIRRLEEGIGLKLFARSNRGLALTKEGEYLYTMMRTPFSNMCKNIQNAKSMQSKPHKVIRVGYPSTYDSSEDYDKLKMLINDYAEKHPDIELNEILFDFLELKHALNFGDVDIAFSHDFILDDVPQVTRKKVCRSRMCLAMSAKHPLAGANSLAEINTAELEKEIFYTIPFNNEASDRKSTIVRLNRYGITPKDVQFVLNFQSLLRVLRQGRGMSVCGYFPNAPGHEEIRFFDFPAMDDDPFLTAAWRTNDISREAQKFIDIIPDDPECMTNFPRR